MTDIAVPRELTYNMPPVVSGMTTFEYRAQTYTNLGQFVPGSTAQIQIAQMPNTYIDPSTSYISLEANISMNIVDNYVLPANSAPNAWIIGGGHSFFNRIQTYFNSGVLLGDTMASGVFAQTWRNISQDVGSRVGDSLAWGGADTLTTPNVGYILAGSGVYRGTHALATGGGTSQAGGANAGGTGNGARSPMLQRVRFSLPLYDFLGQGSAGRLIPAYVGPFRLDLTMAPFTDWFAMDGTQVKGLNSFSITRLEFVCQCVRLSDEMQRIVEASLPVPGQMTIRCNQISTTSVPIPQGSNGAATFLVGTRVQSAKAMLVHYNQAGLGDSVIGSINPCAQSITHDVNAILYPQQLGMVDRVSDSFARLLLAMGVFSTTNGKPGFGLNSYAVSQVVNVPDVPYTAPVPPGAASYGRSNCFYSFTDLESYSARNSGSGFFSGVSTQGAGSFLRIQFAQATTELVNATVFTIHDALITFDLAARTAVRRF